MCILVAPRSKRLYSFPDIANEPMAIVDGKVIGMIKQRICQNTCYYGYYQYAGKTTLKTIILSLVKNSYLYANYKEFFDKS